MQKHFALTSCTSLSASTHSTRCKGKTICAEALERRLVLSAPVITSVNPDPVDLFSAAYATNVHFVINGSNFSLGAGTTARVTLTEPNGKTEQELAYLDTINSTSTQIVLNTPDFDPAGPAGLAPGVWTVHVTNASGAASGQFGFDVSEYATFPKITSITPNPVVIPPSGIATFTIDGSNFQFDAMSLVDASPSAGIGLSPVGANEGYQDPAIDDVNLATSSDTVLYVTTPNLALLPRGQIVVNVVNPSLFVSNDFTITTQSERAPTITSQPLSQTEAIDADVTFSVAASSNVPLAYQWQYDGANIANATLSTLTLDNLTTMQQGEYQVVVSDAAGSVASNGAFLNVTANPIITTQPQNQTAQAGSNVTFTVVADSSSTPRFQWQFQGADIPGDTGSGLTLTHVTAAQAGAYDVVVSNTAGTTTSTAATLTVTAAPTPPTITTQPQSQTVTTGATVAFSVTASSSIALSYQWQFNGNNLSGDTSRTLTLPDVSATQAGAYDVVVTNSAGSATSSSAMLAVTDTPQPPNFVTQPMSQTVSVGDNVTFSATASSSIALSYQWRFNGASLAGDTDSYLALTNVALAQAGAYTVVVSNSIGSITSATATLSVVQPGQLPTITTQPTSQTVTAGDDATFSVAASSPTALSYQWQFDGANLPGETGSSLSLTDVTPSQAGAYTAIVTNATGSATSAPAELTVNPSVAAPDSPLSFTLAGPAAAIKIGKRGKAVLIVTNISDQLVKQSISISLLLSSDTTVAGQVAGLFTGSKNVKLKPGKIKKFALPFKVPALAAGSYELLAQVDGGTPTVAPSQVALVAAPAKK